MIRLRNLTESEQAFAAELRHRVGRITPTRIGYITEGNFTVAMVEVQTRANARLSFRVGVAKRNPIDRDDPRIAEHVAMARALRSETIKL